LTLAVAVQQALNVAKRMGSWILAIAVSKGQVRVRGVGAFSSSPAVSISPLDKEEIFATGYSLNPRQAG